MKLAIIGGLLVLAHCAIGADLKSLKFSESEVASYGEDTWRSMFEAFITKYGKSYDTEEEYNKRFNAYKENYLEAARSNDRHPLAYFGENEFSDYTKEDWNKLEGHFEPSESDEEIIKNAYTYVDSETIRKRRAARRKRVDLPTEFSWCNDERYCTPVKAQGTCGACWAFSAISEIEMMWAIKKGELYNLSQQFLIDCSTSNSGCSGGRSYKAFNDAREIPYYDDYPYEGVGGECKTGFKTNSTDLSFEELAEEIYLNGPVTFSAYSTPELHNYKSGIFECSQEYTTTNHAMVLVGFGVEGGVQYMILRNSWGSTWGENGYGKLRWHSCASNITHYYRPAMIPDEWTCGKNPRETCDCGCGVYDPDCKRFYNSTSKAFELRPSTCAEGTICSIYTGKCVNWTCDPNDYNRGYQCDCNCGSWDPDCESIETYKYVYGCNKTNKEICSRVDGSCVANWTCSMKEYAVPGQCHCDCGVYDPGCSNCSAELFNCAVRPECKEESSSSSESSPKQSISSSSESSSKQSSSSISESSSKQSSYSASDSSTHHKSSTGQVSDSESDSGTNNNGAAGLFGLVNFVLILVSLIMF